MKIIHAQTGIEPTPLPGDTLTDEEIVSIIGGEPRRLPLGGDMGALIVNRDACDPDTGQPRRINHEATRLYRAHVYSMAYIYGDVIHAETFEVPSLC